ncbi:MAG: hypothetical protein KDE14_00205 [Rhodobacteraceae bacterium]|nr:hypothetical protein [Paracoccaceae bacterium]
MAPYTNADFATAPKIVIHPGMKPATGETQASDSVPAEWRAKVEGTLINPASLLATDYLNHFNEVVMLLGMVPDMPEMLEDAKGWKLKSYPEHFRASGLSYGELAAEAYEHIPAATKSAFELTVDQLAMVIEVTVSRLTTAIEKGDADVIRATAQNGTDVMHILTDRIGAVIAGANETLHQSEIDAMMAAVPSGDITSSGGASQADIDALFD